MKKNFEPTIEEPSDNEYYLAYKRGSTTTLDGEKKMDLRNKFYAKKESSGTTEADIEISLERRKKDSDNMAEEIRCITERVRNLGRID